LIEFKLADAAEELWYNARFDWKTFD